MKHTEHTLNHRQHIVTAANVAYGQVGGIPTVQNMASTPASVVDILTTQDKTYGSVSGGVVNTDTEGYEYDLKLYLCCWLCKLKLPWQF